MTEISTWRQAPAQQLLLLNSWSNTALGTHSVPVFVVPPGWEQLSITFVSPYALSLAMQYAPFADEDSRLAAEGLDVFARSLEAEDAIE